MPAMVLTAAYVNITGPGSIHDHLSKAELTADIEEKDVTTFASLGWKEFTGGLKSGQLSFTFLADYAAGNLDSTFWTIFLAGVPVAFEVRATQSAVSTSNPKYTGLVLPKALKMISGTVGDVAGGDNAWTTSGAITRATA
jgi:hypothetical protein